LGYSGRGELGFEGSWAGDWVVVGVATSAFFGFVNAIVDVWIRASIVFNMYREERQIISYVANASQEWMWKSRRMSGKPFSICGRDGGGAPSQACLLVESVGLGERIALHVFLSTSHDLIAWTHDCNISIIRMNRIWRNGVGVVEEDTRR